MLIDTVCPASASDLRRVCLAPARQPDSPSALSVEQHDSALSVSNSRLRLHLDHESFRLTSAAGANIGGRWADCFSATLGNGLPLHARFRNWSITSRNTLRATVRVELEHRDAADIAHLRSTLWIDCFADQPFVLTRHRLEIISPMLAPACGGKVPDDPRFESARSAIAGGEHEQPTILTVQRFELRLPTALGDGLPWRVVVDHDLQHRAGPPGTLVPREGIPSGALSSGDAFVAVRDFWQNYPIGLSRDHSRLCVELLPELPDDYTIPGDEEAQICLGGWIRAGRYWLKSGLALSKDILIGFPSSERDSARWHAWLDNPPLVRATPSHTSAAGVTPPLSIKQTSPLPRYEKLADDALDSLLEDRARYRAFGQLNFGDWYGESGWSWGNNEYDQAFIGYMEFLRGGKPGWATLAAQATRHLTDVDTINHSSDPAQVGLQAMHMPGHLGGYYPPLFRSKIAGTIGLPSHTWVEGALLHWLLTGDPAVRETLDKTKRWLTAPRWFQAYEVPNAREAGWHIIHLCAFAAADNDPDPLQCAKVIVDRVLQRQAPGGGWEHNLLEAHCGCGYPRCRGEAGFMVGVLLASLKRYHALTADPAAAEAIAGGARWLIRRTFDHKTGY
ncbi:MAG TPA: hypothetical protein PKB10_10335, partial [Tepidisphaeraceae bacterium]|nr:hypothetical protein [Tepidisphaeraceae bacterium]